MRRVTTGLLAVLLGFACSGCVMVVGTHEPVEVSRHKRIIEIDDELYLLDLEQGRIRKLDDESARETSLPTTTDTTAKPN